MQMVPAWRYSLRHDPHQFAKLVNLAGFDLDLALAVGTGLEVADRDALAANDEQTNVGLPEPIVERRHGDAETARGLFGGEQVVRHEVLWSPVVAAPLIDDSQAYAAMSKSFALASSLRVVVRRSLGATERINRRSFDAVCRHVSFLRAIHESFRGSAFPCVLGFSPIVGWNMVKAGFHLPNPGEIR